MTMRTTIVSFLRRLFGRAAAASQITGLTAPAAVESQVLRRPQQYGKAKRRAEMHNELHRIDGGGKHYGSKRPYSNHQGSGKGKRSGRR